MSQCSRIIASSFMALVAHAFFAPAGAQPISSDALIKARNNCLTSVAKTVGSPRENLKVIRQRSDASGISVDVKVPNASAPWGCLTSSGAVSRTGKGRWKTCTSRVRKARFDTGYRNVESGP